MPDYIASNLLAFQSRINKRFTAAEQRELQIPILRTGLMNQDYLIVDPESVRQSTKRQVKGYQFKRRAATNGTTRTHNHTGTQGDTQEVTLNWGTFSEPLSILVTIGDDNVIKRPEMLDNQIMQVQRILRERIGTYLLQQLHAGRTTVANASVKNAAFNATNDAFEIANASKDQFFSFMSSVMRQHKYYGPYDVITDSTLFPLYQQQFAQGNQNGENKKYQFMDFSGIWEHTQLGTDVATAYANGAAISLPQNSFAFIPWIPSINRKGHGDYETFVGGYGTLPDSTGLPLKYAVHGYSNRVDGSATNGSTQDVRLELELSVDVAFQVAALSNAGESPIYEFGLLPAA